MSLYRPGRAWETLIALVAALAGGGAGGYLLGSRSAPSSTGPGGSPFENQRVTALGRLQPAGGVVPVFGPPGDRIAKLYDIKPGQVLAAGARVADLASLVDRKKEVQISRTQFEEGNLNRTLAEIAGMKKIAAASAEGDQARANRASDLAALDAKKTFLKLQAESAGKQVKRLRRLRMEGVKIADEDLEKAELLKAQAQAELAAMDATIRKTETTYTEMEKAANARLEAAKAELKESLGRIPFKSNQERLELAEQLCQNAVIKSPIAGTVLRVIGHEGQPTGIEPILQMADLKTMTVIAEVYESDVTRLTDWVRKGGVKAEVRTPALPHTLKGVVHSDKDISRMIARNQVYAMGPREDADRRVVEVVVDLEDPNAKDACGFVGLQVTVTLEPK